MFQLKDYKDDEQEENKDDMFKGEDESRNCGCF